MELVRADLGATCHTIKAEIKMTFLLGPERAWISVGRVQMVFMDTSFDFFFLLPFSLHVYILTTELTSKTDLQAMNGKTLTVTQGSSSPGPAPTTTSLLCPYVNLLLCNAQPSGEKHVNSGNISRPISWRFNIICPPPSSGMCTVTSYSSGELNKNFCRFGYSFFFFTWSQG